MSREENWQTFHDELEQQVRGMVEDHRADINRQVYKDDPNRKRPPFWRRWLNRRGW